MRLEPGFRARRINRQAPDRGPERGGMVHMQKMGCFVRREIIEDETRRHDQAPGKAERARRGARSPPARRIPQGDLARAYPKFLGVARDGGRDVPPGFLDEEVAHPAGRERRLGAHAKQGHAPATWRAIFDPDFFPLRWAMGNPMQRSAQRNQRSRLEGNHFW